MAEVPSGKFPSRPRRLGSVEFHPTWAAPETSLPRWATRCAPYSDGQADVPPPRWLRPPDRSYLEAAFLPASRPGWWTSFLFLGGSTRRGGRFQSLRPLGQRTPPAFPDQLR